MHATRVWSTGDAGEAAPRYIHGPAVDRFAAKIDKNGPVHPRLGARCWRWTAGQDGHGYGQFGLTHSVTVSAARFAFEKTRTS
jgi:hypothetical protein